MSEIILRVEVHEGALVAFETKRGIVATTFGADSLPANLRKMALMIERYDDFSAKNAAHPVAKPIPDERTAEMEQLPAIELVQQERRRQIEVEGWMPEHDATHTMGEMADAAACYAKVAAMISYPGPIPLDVPSGWPWDWKWWKPSSDPIRNLVKAGALIVAEIERLQRLDHIEGKAK